MKLTNNLFTRTAVILLAVVALTSCQDDCLGVVLDYDIQVSVENELGENLLNKNHPDYIDIESASLYYISSDGCEFLLTSDNDDLDQSGSNDFKSNGLEVTGTGDNTKLAITLRPDRLVKRSHTHGDKVITHNWQSECTLLLKWGKSDVDTDTIFSKFVEIKNIDGEPLPNNQCAYMVFDNVRINDKTIVNSYLDYQKDMNSSIYPKIIK